MTLPNALKEPRNRIIALYIAATLFLTLIALGFWLGGFTAKHSNVLKFVYFEAGDPGSDLNLYGRFAELREKGALVFNPPDAPSPFNYSPLAALIFYFLVTVPTSGWALLVIFVALAATLAAILLSRAIGGNWLAQAALLVAVSTSFPFALLFERGNLEGLVWIPSAAGIYFFARKRFLVAAILFALAASIKPVPALLFLLFLPKRRYREFFIASALTVSVAIASFAIVGPSIQVAVQETLRGFRVFSDGIVMQYIDSDIGVDQSLFSLVKQAVRLQAGWPLERTVTNAIHAIYPYYAAFAALLLAFSLFRLRTRPALNQIFGLCVLMLLLSPASHSYTLIQMYIPWAILLLALSSHDCDLNPFASLTLMLCSSVLFTPQSYLILGGSASFGTQVKTVALSVMLLVILVYPMPTKLLEGQTEPGVVTR